MRLPLAPPDSLTQNQRALYDRSKAGIAKGFRAFTTMDADGALLGPWGIFMQEPAIGEAHYDLLAAVTALGRLSPSAKQVALITVGAHFKCAYELYAHVATALSAGMARDKVTALAAGLRPRDLSPDEACAFQVATVLLEGGVLAGAVYANAKSVLGQPALNELLLWISLYASTSLLLNAYDVPSEERFD